MLTPLEKKVAGARAKQTDAKHSARTGGKADMQRNTKASICTVSLSLTEAGSHEEVRR